MLRPNSESIPIRILLDWDGHPNLEFIALFIPIRIGTVMKLSKSRLGCQLQLVPIRIGLNSKLGWPSQSSKIRIWILSRFGRNIYICRVPRTASR